jgi:hypothetical protein
MIKEELTKKFDSVKVWFMDLYAKKNNGWPAVHVDDDVGTLTTGSIIRVLAENADINFAQMKPAIDYILKNQLAGGAWALIRGENLASTLATAEIVQALCVLSKKFRNYGENTQINTALLNGINWLKQEQNTDGGWGYAAHHGTLANIPPHKRSNTYATAVALIALIVCSRAQIIESIDSIKQKAIQYLNSCRDPQGYWKIHINKPETDLALSSAIAYACYLADNESFADVLELFSFAGMDRDRGILSLPVGMVSLQLSDGEVNFYINGAFWGMRLFLEAKKPYIGYLPFIKYTIENQSNYFCLTCLAKGIVWAPTTWVTCDLYEIGRKLISDFDLYITQSVLLAAKFLSYNKDVTKYIGLAENTPEEFLYKVCESAICRDDVIFGEAIAYCYNMLPLCTQGNWLEQASKLLHNKLKTIATYDEYRKFSGKKMFVGGTLIKQVDALVGIITVIKYLVEKKYALAQKCFYRTVCVKAQGVISYEIFSELSQLIHDLMQIYDNDDRESVQKQASKLKNILIEHYNEVLINSLFLTIENNIIAMYSPLLQNSNEDPDYKKITKSFTIGKTINECKDLFGREELLEEVEISLVNGSHIAISGEFRMGKSSFIECIAKIFQSKNNYIVVKVDLTTQMALDNTVERFVFIIISEIKKLFEEKGIKSYKSERLKDALFRFAQYFGGINFSGFGFTLEKTFKNTQPHIGMALPGIEDFFKEIDSCLELEQSKMLIVIDEYNMSSSDETHGQVIAVICRGITQNAKNIQFLLAAQNIFNAQPAHLSVPILNIFVLKKLEGISSEKILAIVKNLEAKINFETNALNLFMFETGGSPYWIRILFNQVFQVLNKKRHYMININDVKESIEALLHTEDAKIKLKWNFDSAINTSNTNIQLNKEVIKILALNKFGMKKDNIIKQLENFKSEDVNNTINSLISKGTISEENGIYLIGNKLLQKWIADNAS